jgi:hypothetical protein
VKWRAIVCLLVLGLASCASRAPSVQPSESQELSSPSLPSGPVTLSPEEYFAVETDILQGREALRIAKEQLTRDEQLLATLWTFSAALVLAQVLDGIADIIWK